jgi:hypothetical protein
MSAAASPRKGSKDMSKGRQLLRRRDTMRLIKAARDAGLEVRKVTADQDGRIEIEVGPPTAPTDSPSELDRWLNKRPDNAHSA